MRTRIICAMAPLVVAGIAGVTDGAEINVSIENMNAGGGFFFTPFWIAAHDGGFDSYDGGSLASAFPGLTELAEGGDTGPISAAFASSAAGLAGGVDGTVTSVTGGGDPPVFSPGEATTFVLDVGDGSINRYFSYASMVIPSNDLFVANGNPLAHELFNSSGDFVGPVVIDIFGSGVNDNGSEVNDASAGAAFSALGGDGVDEELPIRNFFTDPGDVDYLASFLGTGTASGDTITEVFGPGDLIARITITPAPGALALLAFAGMARTRRRE